MAKKQKAVAVVRKSHLRSDQLFVHGTTYSPRYDGHALAIPEINVLAQPRKTFEGIEELSLDIAKKRVLNPPTVARFDCEGCRQYVAAVNRLWGTAYDIDKLRSKKEAGAEVFYVLLAGERRFRSCALLWERGCAECIETLGEEKPGRCFKRHFGGDKLDVRICRDIPPLAALFLQLSENTHVPVPSHEEAAAYARLFGLIRKADEAFPIARFAREVGRSPETIRKALRYHLLPDIAKEAVECGHVPYGTAVEIARLQEDGLTPDQLEFWIQRSIVERRRVDEFRKLVDAHLAERHSGQQSLLDMFQSEQAALTSKAHIRRTVEAKSVQALWGNIHYIARVQQLIEGGMLGAPDAAYSEDSPLRVYGTLVERMRELLPKLRALLSARKGKDYQAVLDETHSLLVGLGAIEPDHST
jgi:hypothetical protein